ncbi:DUF6092 family protein [Nonomuraea composti]|uniref:DUF6092 family protein n=1 Tax=Nonomuraea composti TaxID=2720023 RepID=UPI001F0D43E6|nr:DUF6092 family protein [Nonomuraea sp. FMUSA5-5]
MTAREIGEELLLIAAYLLSSGRGLLDEPAAYGPLRCLDAARRVLTLAIRAGAGNEDVAALRAELDDVMCGAMTERDLDHFLDHLCERLGALLHESDLIQTTRG